MVSHYSLKRPRYSFTVIVIGSKGLSQSSRAAASCLSCFLDGDLKLNVLVGDGQGHRIPDARTCL